MLRGKTFRDLVILDRYIAEREAQLQALLDAAARQDAGAPADVRIEAMRRALDALRARREGIALQCGLAQSR